MRMLIKLKFCRFLYNLNLFFFNYFNKIDEAPIFKNENFYEVVKVNFSEFELEKIKSDFKKNNAIR